jgi:hypothetical protein
MSIEIIKAEYLTEYRIELLFSDSTTQIIDLKAFLESTQNPVTRKYLDINLFKDFTIEFGDLIWNDYELCFPIIDLYENIFSKKMHSVA